MTIKIGGIDVPASMRSRALAYRYDVGEQPTRNGMGEVQVAGGAIVTWIWAVLNQSEYNFLASTLLGGQPSKAFTGAFGSTILYDDVQVEKSFSSCIVLKPKYDGYTGVLYQNVQLVIDCLF